MHRSGTFSVQLTLIMWFRAAPHMHPGIMFDFRLSFSRSGRGPVCISNEVPRDADAVVPGPHLDHTGLRQKVNNELKG